MYNLLVGCFVDNYRFPGRIHTVEFEFAIIKALTSEIMGQNFRLISKSDIFPSKPLTENFFFHIGFT